MLLNKELDRTLSHLPLETLNRGNKKTLYKSSETFLSNNHISAWHDKKMATTH